MVELRVNKTHLGLEFRELLGGGVCRGPQKFLSLEYLFQFYKAIRNIPSVKVLVAPNPSPNIPLRIYSINTHHICKE